MNFSYPLRIDGFGRTAMTASEEQHVKQLVEQVLFTTLGERVNRPDFGSGINQLIFGPNSQEIASATQLLVQGALQTWLGSLILVEFVDIKTRESTLEVTVQYRLKESGKQHSLKFTKEV